MNPLKENDVSLGNETSYGNIAITRPATRGGDNRAIDPPRNFHKRVYLLGAARTYIVPPPENIIWLRP